VLGVGLPCGIWHSAGGDKFGPGAGFHLRVKTQLLRYSARMLRTTLAPNAPS
jgi:hypothetical protein